MALGANRFETGAVSTDFIGRVLAQQLLRTKGRAYVEGYITPWLVGTIVQPIGMAGQFFREKLLPYVHYRTNNLIAQAS
jgi:hypothetical protein